MSARPDFRGYGAVWRLHFIAGLLVLPLLMLMAATGGAYLFKDEIDSAIYGDVLRAPPAADIQPSRWLAAAEAATGGVVTRITVPADGRSAEALVRRPVGDLARLHLDPASAAVLGETPPDGAMAWVKDLHSLTLLGPQANLLPELAAGWAIVLVATGAILWWPRRSQRLAPGSRTLWRRVHGWTGSFAGLVIVFLALTGMPWSAVWGQQARALTNAAGWGRPAAPPAAGAWAPGPAAGHAAHGAAPWALQGEHLIHSSAPVPVDRAATLDAAVQTALAQDLPRPFTIALSDDPALAWSVTHMAAKAEDQRTLYIDPTGKVVADIGYGDFGPAAQAIEWGVATHQGRQYGPLNRGIMLAGCVAIWILALSGLAMWWIRRPRGRLGVPPRPLSRRRYILLAAVVTPLALLFPLVGASLIVGMAIDLILQRLTTRPAVPSPGAHA
ncbi:MAG: PepSY domain-containing protein [Phenylobacterium sp.]|uniref:PepSY-associated TM helix domain-containing protein n=1 Tax=Phenylobacterium sp. TaxID=1871053 RepID=UPI002717A861|nr:PepSY domain-containing protein [Phenylobacterium sp.]MDO8410424.1 PepSY domain-containing protein [Phenylobacterium sp.]